MNILEYSTSPKYLGHKYPKRSFRTGALHSGINWEEASESGFVLTPEEKLFRVLTSGRSSAGTCLDSEVIFEENESASKIFKKGRFQSKSIAILLAAGIVCVSAVIVLVTFSARQKTVPVRSESLLVSSVALPIQPEVKSAEPAVIIKPAYRLVGISWDENGYVAMIEKEGQSARFVRKGEDLGEGLRVLDISESSIQLEGSGRYWTLR